jgi:hypothetical protein
MPVLVLIAPGWFVLLVNHPENRSAVACVDAKGL